MSKSSRDRRRPAWGLSIIGVGLGGVLLVVGVVHFAAAVHLLKGRQAVEILESGQLPSPAGLTRILDSRESALAWRDLPGAWVERATVTLALAQMAPPGDEERSVLLAKAASAYEQGLELAPVDPHGWLRLAFVLAEVGDFEAAAGAVDLSLITGPSVPELALPRSAIGLALWPLLEPRTRSRFAPEFARAVERNPDAFIRDVRASGHEAKVLEALASLPEARTTLLRGLEGTTDGESR